MSHRGDRSETVTVLASADAVAREAAGLVARLAREAADLRGRFTVALSGGSTPDRLYRLLAGDGGPAYRDAIPWNRVHVFFGDERHVAPTHPDSNYRLACEALLSRVPVPAAQVHRVKAEHPDAAQVARAYEADLREAFALESFEVPSFDLLIQGIGADGHTASIFPGSDVVRERSRLVAAPWVEKLGAHRITFTPPVLTNGRHVLVLAVGDGKAAVLRDVLEGTIDLDRLPAQLLRGSAGPVTWLLDRAAGSMLSRAAR